MSSSYKIDENGYITWFDGPTKTVTYNFSMVGGETMFVKLKDDIVVSVKYSNDAFKQCEHKECDHNLYVLTRHPWEYKCRLCGKIFDENEYKEFMGPRPKCYMCGAEMHQTGRHKMVCWGVACNTTIKHETGTPYPETSFTFAPKECDHIVVVDTSQSFGSPRSYCRLCDKIFTNEEWLEFAGPKPTCIKCGKTMWQYGKHKMICHGEGCDYTIDHESGTPYPETPKPFEPDHEIRELRGKLTVAESTIECKEDEIAIMQTRLDDSHIKLDDAKTGLITRDNQITRLIGDLCQRAEDYAHLEEKAMGAITAWEHWKVEHVNVRYEYGGYMKQWHFSDIGNAIKALHKRLKK